MVLSLLHQISPDSRHREFIKRARRLALGKIIQFRMCAASARMQGFSAQDFPEFIQMTPMADAEMIKLQNEGYAYLK